MKISVREAKTHLSRLLQRVAAGEEVMIANGGIPVARLVPIEPSQSRRQLGMDEGKIWMSDDFDAPSPELEALFAGTKPSKVKAKG